MKKILVIGAYEGSELLLYMARILIQLEQNILIVDATDRQTYRLFNTSAKHTAFFEFDQIDMISGVRSWDDLDRTLNPSNEQERYNFALIHTDQFHQSFIAADHYLLLSSYDRNVIQHNLALLQQFTLQKNRPAFSHVIFHTDGCIIDEFYITELFRSFPVHWYEDVYVFHNDELNLAVKYNNQYEGTISIRRLSRSYKHTLARLISDVTSVDENVVKRAIKKSARRR
jgi:hypothetical protein